MAVGSELRLQQELVLGIGGWRVIEALGLRAHVCHLNEGHAAFAVLERARSFMRGTGQPFDVALSTTRAGNVFTTHTAVAAGFDRFAPPLIEQYLGEYATRDLQVPMRELLALGRRNAADDSESFNMAYLAVRGSGAVNGVSQLHAEVSRRIFLPLFPQWPEVRCPSATLPTACICQAGTAAARTSCGPMHAARIAGWAHSSPWEREFAPFQRQSCGSAGLLRARSWWTMPERVSPHSSPRAAQARWR